MHASDSASGPRGDAIFTPVQRVRGTVRFRDINIVGGDEVTFVLFVLAWFAGEGRINEE